MVKERKKPVLAVPLMLEENFAKLCRNLLATKLRFLDGRGETLDVAYVIFTPEGDNNDFLTALSCKAKNITVNQAVSNKPLALPHIRQYPRSDFIGKPALFRIEVEEEADRKREEKDRRQKSAAHKAHNARTSNLDGSGLCPPVGKKIAYRDRGKDREHHRRKAKRRHERSGRELRDRSENRNYRHNRVKHPHHQPLLAAESLDARENRNSERQNREERNNEPKANAEEHIDIHLLCIDISLEIADLRECHEDACKKECEEKYRGSSIAPA